VRIPRLEAVAVPRQPQGRQSEAVDRWARRAHSATAVCRE